MPRNPGHGSQSSETPLKVDKRLRHHDSFQTLSAVARCHENGVRSGRHMATPLAKVLQEFRANFVWRRALWRRIAGQSRVQALTEFGGGWTRSLSESGPLAGAGW